MIWNFSCRKSIQDKSSDEIILCIVFGDRTFEETLSFDIRVEAVIIVFQIFYSFNIKANKTNYLVSQHCKLLYNSYVDYSGAKYHDYPLPLA